jgi:hypothetical protein
MHTIDTWGDSNPKNVKGTSIAIAYESDINKVTPEQFAVISVNYTSPWFQQTDYRIPGDLPACPSGGCLCMWCKFRPRIAHLLKLTACRFPPMQPGSIPSKEGVSRSINWHTGARSPVRLERAPFLLVSLIHGPAHEGVS